ncbi:MAG: EAL domain-containing protein [Sphingobium sp.]|nr:EAL domain-containing protein [Sphingobium sp.]
MNGCPIAIGRTAPETAFWLETLDGVLLLAVMDPTGRLIFANQGFRDMSGLVASSLGTIDHRYLRARLRNRKILRHLYRTLNAGRIWRGEIRYRTALGDRWLDAAIIPVRDESGGIANIAGCAFEVTERRKVQRDLLKSATIDPLTGLLTRQAFHAELADLLETAAATDSHAAVIVLDVDHFKNINDSYGHDAGDELLRVVAQRVRQTVRATDIVGRLGGDELAIAFSPIPSEARLHAVLNNLKVAIRQPLEMKIGRNIVTASIGAACFPRDGQGPDELLTQADLALYAAKRAGRDRSEVFAPHLLEATRRRSQLQHEARSSLALGEFYFDFQPIVGLRSRQVEGVEALLRWRHPHHGILSPGEFSDVFQDYRISASIRELVFEAIADQAARWKAEDVPFGRIAINTSGADFAAPGFTQRLVAILDSRGIGPDSVAIEVTEAMFLGAHADVVRQEVDLLSLGGFQVAYDDFGRGFASINHLKALRIHQVKIDQSLIWQVAGDEAARTTVNTLIHLAHSLGLIVTAEGVETRDQRELLDLMGCDQIQGYLVAHPLPADKVPELCFSMATAAKSLSESRPTRSGFAARQRRGGPAA